MSSNALAFFFARNIDTFQTGGPKLMGRQAANAGFLRAILEHLPHRLGAWCHEEGASRSSASR